MPDNESRPVLSFLTSHWLSVLGSALVTIAGCSWLFLVALHAGGETANPYVGILIAFAIPAVFFAGLILIPIGSWLARRRIQSGLAQAPSRRVALRRLTLFFVTMTVVNVVIASQVTYRAVTHMETEQFCGQSCHVMKPQFTAHRRTVHRNVGMRRMPYSAGRGRLCAGQDERNAAACRSHAEQLPPADPTRASIEPSGIVG